MINNLRLRSARLSPPRPNQTLASDRKGSMAIMLALLFPTMIALGLLAVDAARLYSQVSLFNQAMQMAALAGGTKIGSYYSQGATAGATTIQNFTTTIARSNATLLTDATTSSTITTTLGNWSGSTFTSLATSNGTTPDAVQVTGSANLPTIFAGLLTGATSFPVSKTSVSTLGSAATFNVIVLNDIGSNVSTAQVQPIFGSQGLYWAQVQAADTAILNCVANSGISAAKFGVTAFHGSATTYQALTTVSTAAATTTVSNTINNVGSTANSGKGVFVYCNQYKTPAAPACRGTNVAAGLYSAISQFSGAAYVGANNHILIIDSQMPIVDPRSPSMTYDQSTGTYVSSSGGRGTGSSATSLCGASGQSACTTSSLLVMAEGQAIAAGTAVSGGRAGITISTLYYSGDAGVASTPSGQSSLYTSEMATWAQNGGTSIATATLTDIPTQAANICKLIRSTSQLVLTSS